MRTNSLKNVYRKLTADAPIEARNMNAEHRSFANEGRRNCDDFQSLVP
jgi:hypothetical protein